MRIGPQLLDSDGDGLSDYDESNGMRTVLGNTIQTDPNNPDSDNDNLPDGLEMGIRKEDYYIHVSDPTKTDSDGDELNDDEERAFGTSPLFDRDSDNDGLWDGEEVHILDTNPASPDSNGNGVWDGYEYFYSNGYQDQNQYLFLNTGTSMLHYEVEAPVTVEDIDLSMQSSLELAYDLGFDGVKFFCLGDFAEGRLTASGAFDTTLCAGDVAAFICPYDGPGGEAAITSVKTARFVSGVKKWFKFSKVPNALHKLQKAVRKYLNITSVPEPEKRAKKASKLDEYKDYITTKLHEGP
ncbi:MAG: hypothetical protein M8353_10835, partial [ANME-2 cluster archaeon]|nr:hypothetical protein [ANME-2 cluster archaeon]